jgi:membrane fusion protein (multidrug efflux system)
MNATRPEVRANSASEAGRPALPLAGTTTRTATLGVAEARIPRQKRRAALSVGLIALALAAGWAGWRWWHYAATWESTDNAYVSGHVHTVSARIAGNVSEVLVTENEAVPAGAVLARLDRSDLEVEREKARASLAQVQAEIGQARAQVSSQEAVVSKSQQDFERADQLFHNSAGAISKQEFDAAKAALDAAKGSLSASQALVLAAEARLKAAGAEVKSVELQLGYTDIIAPAAGRVGRKNLELGNRVLPGQGLLAIVQSNVWVTANFKETQLNHLRPGQRVSLRVDSFPGHEFTGAVESLAPASGAQFALLPPDNATGNFTKIVQRVPVRIVFDEESLRDFAGRIVPGMSVAVRVNVRS